MSRLRLALGVSGKRCQARVQQPGLGLTERALRIAASEEMARGEEDLVAVGRGIFALGEVDAGEKGVEPGKLVFPAVGARSFDTAIAEGASGGEVAEVEVVARVVGTPW